MASLGQTIFIILISLIVIFTLLIILILALALSGQLSVVESNNRLPIANLGTDQLLSCYISLPSAETQVNQVSITWMKKELSGVVYKYQHGAPILQDQNEEFKGRTHLFPNVIIKGNASLLLRSVRESDDGTYTCSLSSSGGKGTISINLRTAAYTAPQFMVKNDSLVAEATRWFPEPAVIWTQFGGGVLNATTSYTPNSAGILTVISTLTPFNVSDTYTCRIENSLVISVSEVTVSDLGKISVNTYFTFDTATSLLAPAHLSLLVSVLWTCLLS